jgi:hypothetical protein
MKKGVIRDWLIIIIILIISAAILIYFVTRMMQSGMDKREVCRQSVVLRSKSIMGIEPGRVLPLNCETQVYKIKTMEENKIKKNIADALYDCWYMMGEGKLDFLSETDGKNACVICGIIKFDEDLRGKKIDGIVDYLINTKIPGKNITYMEYFLEGNREKIEKDILKEENFVDSLYTNQDYAIIFVIVEAPEAEEFLKVIIGVGGTKLLPLIGKIISTKLLVAGLIIGLIEPTTNLIQTYIKCGIGKGRCVSMLFIPYNVASISKNCNTILSIPPKED